MLSLAPPSIALAPRWCPICGPGGPSRLFAEANVALEELNGYAFASRKLPEYMHWQLRECRRCDLVYADPAPGPDDLAALYRDADFDSAGEARYASRTYARLLPRIVPNLPDRDGAADIGTGDGAFLHELLAAGFRQVCGIEPSLAPIRAAEPAVQPLIRRGIFRDDSFEPGSLALITCFQTIEHLADPLSFCHAAHRALKPGGALFLIGHNRRAISARVLGRKSPIYDIEHLQLFSPTSLRRLLESSGFGRVELRPIFNNYPLQYWARLFPFPSSVKRRILDAMQSSRAGRWMLPLPAGNVAAIAYKPTPGR
jgi:SAM-dependent methyltransferase